MSSDYLWDATGPVDPDVARLEELLRELRCDRTWEPVPVRRRLGPVVAALAAAAGVAGVLGWSALQNTTSVSGERLASTPANVPAAGAPKIVDPLLGKPPPRSPRAGVVLDPFKGSPRVAGSAPPPSKLLDPFAGKSAPSPKPGTDGVLDPWATAKTRGRPASDPPDAATVVNPWASSKTKSLGVSEVTRVIERHRSDVAGACWRKARDQAPKSAPDTARVVLVLHIAASGRVAGATATDPRGYPGLGSCVAGRAKHWVFPASSSGTTVNVPFVFAR